MFRNAFILALGWFVMITVLLLLPGSEFPSITWLTRIWFDKWVHLGFFIVLVILWCRVLKNKNLSREKLKKMFVAITLLSFAYGILMEIVQHYLIPFRSFDTGDIVADGVGSLVGYFIATGWYIKK